MSRIEVEYGGFKIVYGDNDDLWHCYALNLDAKTLSSLKEQIGKVLTEARKVGNRPVLRISTGYNAGFEAGVLMRLDASGTHDKQPAGWVTFVKPKSGAAERRKIALSELADDTPENRSTVKSYLKRLSELRQMREAADDTIARIPRITEAALKESKTHD